MGMSEATVVVKALELQRAAGIDAAPVSISKYLDHLHVKLDVRFDLDDDEAGQTFPVGQQWHVWVNGHDRPERQRFTILHELAHIYLGLPSRHAGRVSGDAMFSYSRRPPEEVFCDVFAAECLLPRDLFLPEVRQGLCCLERVSELAARYQASFLATGSRFAACSALPCAWVMAEGGNVRFVSVSPALRERGFWADLGAPVPGRSVLGRLLSGNSDITQGEVPAHMWSTQAVRGIATLYEEATILQSYSQAICLLSAEEDEIRDTDDPRSDEDDDLLRPLDGTLRFEKRVRKR